MKKIKNVLIIFGFILISSCGYTPLLNQEKINFYISDFIFEGDRQVNNYIENNLKNYKISKDNVKIETYATAQPKNCKSSYFLEMAEKRSKARAILQITEFYSLGVYSEVESDEFKKSNN